MARSVLLAADQDAGRLPDRCVLSGVPTNRAVRLLAPAWNGPTWMLGIPGFPLVLRCLPGWPSVSVALPMSSHVWTRWRRRTVAAIAAVSAGSTFAAIGVVAHVTGLVVLGALVVIAGVAYRSRAHHDYWVSGRFRPETATIVVEPTHPGFDQQARDLYIRWIGRR
jgi:hypothetical protein